MSPHLPVVAATAVAIVVVVAAVAIVATVVAATVVVATAVVAAIGNKGNEASKMRRRAMGEGHGPNVGRGGGRLGRAWAEDEARVRVCA